MAVYSLTGDATSPFHAEPAQKGPRDPNLLARSVMEDLIGETMEGKLLPSTIGMLQVNAVTFDSIGSGPQPVVLTIEQTNNASQQVTVAIQ